MKQIEEKLAQNPNTPDKNSLLAEKELCQQQIYDITNRPQILRKIYSFFN